MNRFKKNRAGAAWPLRSDELLQARSRLLASSAMWGHRIQRITADGFFEQAEYWVGAPESFISSSTQLSSDAMKGITQGVRQLAAVCQGYDPEVEPDDCGRSISFWHDGKHRVVFIADHSASYAPTSACRSVFEKLWSRITEGGASKAEHSAAGQLLEPSTFLIP